MKCLPSLYALTSVPGGAAAVVPLLQEILCLHEIETLLPYLTDENFTRVRGLGGWVR
jgi:hypothetical protein